MDVYAFPSIILLFVKAWLVFTAKQDLFLKENRFLLMLLISMLSINIIEIISFTPFIHPYFPSHLLVLKLFYVGMMFTVTSIFCISLQLRNRLSLLHICLSYIAAIFLSILLLQTNSIIYGMASIGYSQTRVPGEYYIVFQLYMILGFMYSFFQLCLGFKYNKEYINQRRCLVLILSLLPFMISISAIIFFMALGVKINAVLVSSITITLFLTVLVYSTNEFNIFRILAVIPFTKERKSILFMHELFENTISQIRKNSCVSLKEITEKFEATIIDSIFEDILGKHETITQTEAEKRTAYLLSVSPSKVHKRRTKPNHFGCTQKS